MTMLGHADAPTTELEGPVLQLVSDSVRSPRPVSLRIHLCTLHLVDCGDVGGALLGGTLRLIRPTL